MESISDEAGAGPDLRKTRRRRAATNGSVNVDRLPPHAPDSEKSIIACILDSAVESMGLCVERFKDPEVFYDLRYQTIYRVAVEMFEAREPIDIITLAQKLSDRRLLEEVGGAAHLSYILADFISTANLPTYLQIVEDKWVLRKTIHTCTDIVGKIYDYEGDVDEVMDGVERDILAVRPPKVTGQISSAELVDRATVQIERLYAKGMGVSGLSTGFLDLDRMTDGLHGGNMIVIAARPSMGKTSLAMNIAEHVAVVNRIPVGVFSLEMTADELMLRNLCSMARVNLRNMREGFMAESDFPKLTRAAGRYRKAPLHIDESSGLSIMQLRARARRMWQQHGIKLFVVDYLQLLHSTSKKARDNRNQEVADISKGIKELAKELKVPVIILSQLNRELDKEKRLPRLADLRESGAIEQDSDFVGFLHKPKHDDDDERPHEDQDGIPVDLLIAKQRNGPTGPVHLTFVKPYTRFESAAKVSDDDVPHDELPFTPKNT